MFASKTLNFLAHALLSGNNNEILLGNFVADSVKGKMLENYGTAFRQGVKLHRAIDHFTDTHPLVIACNQLVQPHFRKFSGVVTDIYFDHFLARHWNKYSSRPLSEFVTEVYDLLNKNFDRLPPRSQRIIPWMVELNWLEGYADFLMLERVFQGMSNRTKFESGMAKAVEVLRLEYAFLEKNFLEYFPQLQTFSNDFLNDLKQMEKLDP